VPVGLNSIMEVSEDDLYSKSSDRGNRGFGSSDYWNIKEKDLV